MGKRLPVSILFLALAPLLIIAVHAKVPAVIVFGDSSVDAGNNNFIPTVARSNFQPYGRDFSGGKATGRFSNGRIATDFISEAFGLRPTIPAYLDPAYNISDFAVGVTFASAGTGYDNATSDVLVSTTAAVYSPGMNIIVYIWYLYYLILPIQPRSSINFF
ncbi:unnamed protein product [Linum tenue]|uniref:GDSL esterase/lipase n=1 Tax=Linum tenue TaxID=586396 RepID=A0AAV0R1J1_9ROSI|nr:unnamed protein product [Linum tenue]